MTKLALAALLIGLVACGGDGRNNNTVIIIDASIDALATCNPLTQTGCPMGEKCASRTLQGPPNPINEIACVPNGMGTQDMPCTTGAPGATGYSDCAAGFECVNRVCKQICDHQGGNPKCDANHACSRYEGLFESGDMTVAGVCDPKCDPLTQALLVGTTTAACGSMDPAAPTNGCYTFDLIDFTCAGIPMPARGLTDRMKAYGPASGGAYVNGCAGGFLPFFREQTGSTVTVCAGLCAPVKTDNSVPNKDIVNKGDPNAVAKLPTEADPAPGNGVCTVGKKGSEFNQNCHFLWMYNNDGMNYLPGPYNDTLGVCFGFTHYRYNATANGGSAMEQYPACQQLPPKGAPPLMPHGNADDWPCYSSVDAAVFVNGKSTMKVNPVVKEFRVGARPGAGLRHLIREN